jgi:hypothetical protein
MAQKVLELGVFRRCVQQSKFSVVYDHPPRLIYRHEVEVRHHSGRVVFELNYAQAAWTLVP